MDIERIDWWNEPFCIEKTIDPMNGCKPLKIYEFGTASQFKEKQKSYDALAVERNKLDMKYWFNIDIDDKREKTV